MCFSFFVCFLSPLVWFFLWLREEVLALLFLLHRENGDFSILMKDDFIFAGFGECQGRRIRRHQVVYLGSQPISKWLKRNGIRACATLLMLAPPLVASYIVSDAFYSASNFAVSGFLADCGSLL